MARSETRLTSAYPVDWTDRPARSLHVTLIAANTFEFDSRFLRTALTLADDGHEVTVAAFAGPDLRGESTLAPGVKLVRLDFDRRLDLALRPMPTRLRHRISRSLGLEGAATVLAPEPAVGEERMRRVLRRLVEIAANIRRVRPWTDAVSEVAGRSDVYHCQSLVALPVALAASRRAGGALVYDVADYHSETERLARMPGTVKAAIRAVERRWAVQAAAHLAVSDPVADLVAQEWHVDRPAVLLNCPPAWRPDDAEAPRRGPLRDALGISPGRPIVLYQGGLSIERGLGELVAASRSSRFRETGAVVVFMGYGRLEAALRRVAQDSHGTVHVLPAVPPDMLLEWTAGADVAYVGQPTRTLNWRLNLPNKLFESLMAGVPVIVSRGGEQCRLVSAEGVGRCTVIKPSAIVSAITELLGASDAERDALRRHCRRVALDRYTWDQNAGGLLAAYRRLAATL